VGYEHAPKGIKCR